MSAKRILVLNGHPAPKSLSRSLAESYAEAALGAGHEVHEWHVPDMAFDPDHDMGGYASNKPLEPVLEAFLSDLEWCEHVVICTPMWWGSVPAKLKGLFDRSLIPGRAFHARDTTRIGMPKPLLTGKTARVVITADTPAFFLRLAYGNAIKRQLKDQILGFVGIKPVRFSYLAPASKPSAEQIERWKNELRQQAQVAR